jgi:hypothetical protein
MSYPTVLTSTGLLLLSTGLSTPGYGQLRPYSGIYALAPGPSINSGTLNTNDARTLQRAFINPFVSGLTLVADWNQIEPLPPGVNFVSGAFTLTGMTGAVTSVTLTCQDATDNYCWDTVDAQLNLIPPSRLSPETITFPGAGGLATTRTVKPLAVGLDILAGFNSPAWLSYDPITVNAAAGQVSVDFSSTQVAAAATAGSYSTLGTVSCPNYADSGFQSPSICPTGQGFTTWQGFASNMGTDCAMVKLPLPFGPSNTVAPYAQLYVDMITALQNHLATGPFTNAGTFTNITVIKLGAALSGQDGEITLLGGNNLGSGSFPYPPEYGSSSISDNACPGPTTVISGTSYPYNYVWENSYAYNPINTELTWEYIANAIGTLFNGSASGTATLLDLDVHSDPQSAFPDISFDVSNTNTLAIYTGTSYDYNADGPNTQDDIVLCDLVGTYTPSTGTSIMLGVGGGNEVSANSATYFAGFHGSTVNHCLTGSRAQHHQPLQFSLPNGYQWGIEQDGLTPITGSSTDGTYSHGAAMGLELSWGTNGGGDSGGALCGVGAGYDNSCADASSQTSTCGTGTSGMPLACYLALEDMLEKGLYSYAGDSPTGQYYQMYAADLCNPYLWLGLAPANQAIDGFNLTTAELGISNASTYNVCNGTSQGTFDSNGTFTLLE